MPEHRGPGPLDAELCADQASLDGKGDKRIEADAKKIAYRLDPQAIVERAVRAESERTVTSRPAPDNMAYVTALLPMKQGVAVYATLKRQADATFDDRSRGQVMADTFVERVTGRPAVVPVPVAVNVVISDEALLGGDTAPARVEGYGPVPAAVARHLIAAAVGDKLSRATLRRLYKHPRSGALVAMESRARVFPKGLAAFIDLRDDRCRTPYCDAPDPPSRPRPARLAWRADQRRQRAGSVRSLQLRQGGTGLAGVHPHRQTGTHTAEFTTPTGARHRSKAPPMPGIIDLATASAIEAKLGIRIVLHAA